MSEWCKEYQFSGVDVYRLIVDVAEEGIWVLDSTDVIVFANPKLLSMLGYSKDELLCHSMYDIVADEDADIVRKALDRRHKGVTETYTVKLRKKDSSFIWVALAATPLIAPQGSYKGAVTLASDISLVKQSEEALKREKSIANMYLDLMAHDINNLHQVAIGYMEVAIDQLQRENPEGCKVLDFLAKSLDTMYQQTALIHNVKTLQQVKTEQMRFETIDLSEIIREAIGDYPKVPGREAKIVYEPVSGCYVQANRLLKEVFTNLIGNSVKHSQGSVNVWITVDSVIENGQKYYEVSVADDGPGIPDEMKGQLFRRLDRAGMKSSGHALGLYLVKTLVEDFAGQVRVEDRVHGDSTRGVKFIVLLPAAT